MSREKPYYHDKDGQCPPWFKQEGQFDPNSYDPGYPFVPRGEIFETVTNKGHKIESAFDLDNLRIIDPEEVLNACHSLEKVAENGHPSICVIATGGTIATKREGGSLVPGLDIDFLFEYAGKLLDKNWNRVSISLPTLIDSSQMHVDYDSDIVIATSFLWASLSEQARKYFRGFAITHGTDTMAQSATRLAFMYGPNLDYSVGIVGSQVGIDSDFNEVSDNISRCVATLDKLYDHGRNCTFLYMGGSAGGAFNPSGTRKRSDTDIVGFESQAIPQIVDASNTIRMNDLILPFLDKYIQVRHPRLDVYRPIILRGWSNSRRLEAEMDLPPQELSALIDSYSASVKAILLTTYGSFTFDRQQADAIIGTSAQRKMMVFATNPFPTGRVDHDYADAQYLISKGAIPLHMMPHAAGVKLQIAEVLWGSDNDYIKAFMTSNTFIGEQPPIWTPRPTNIPMRELGLPREPFAGIELKPSPSI